MKNSLEVYAAVQRAMRVALRDEDYAYFQLLADEAAVLLQRINEERDRSLGCR